jgi:hypothetical protein
LPIVPNVLGGRNFSSSHRAAEAKTTRQVPQTAGIINPVRIVSSFLLDVRVKSSSSSIQREPTVSTSDASMEVNATQAIEEFTQLACLPKDALTHRRVR